MYIIYLPAVSIRHFYEITKKYYYIKLKREVAATIVCKGRLNPKYGPDRLVIYTYLAYNRTRLHFFS